jgi:prevent-host-death family protein
MALSIELCFIYVDFNYFYIIYRTHIYFYVYGGTMKKTISNVEFRRSFGEVLDHVSTTKKPICITQHGIPWVVLRHPVDLQTECAEFEPALSVRLKLSAHINAVHYQRKPLVITRRSTAIACICPVANE